MVYRNGFVLMLIAFHILINVNKVVTRLRSNVACGIRYSIAAKRLRVIGGSRAYSGDHPWNAYVLKSGRQHCGGTVIDREWVLTAAHCLARVREPLRVLVGSYHYRNAYGKGTFHRIRNRIIHPQYNPLVSYQADIAMIRIYPPFVYKSGDRTGRGAVIPICLPRQDQEFPSTDARVSGYGLTREGGTASTMLNTVRVKLLKREACRRYTGVRLFLADRMICAGTTAGGRDACQGDSGGPLSIVYQGRVYQAGIVSFGEGCGRPRFPGVYTRVAFYRDWIEETLNKY